MATQSVTCSYQEIIDLHTESDTVSVVGIHTPTGDVPNQLFSGFYKQFKKFKYLGASLAMVPAARLPADPLQVSYEAGEPTIDPRDMLNPIMFHGCHGNDMGSILNSLYAYGSVNPPTVSGNTSVPLLSATVGRFSSAEMTSWPFTQENSPNNALAVAESLYYKALTDNTWLKAHPQKGFRKNGLRPLVYNLATTHQILNNTGVNRSGAQVPSPQDTEYISGQGTRQYVGNLGASVNSGTPDPANEAPGSDSLVINPAPAGARVAFSTGTIVNAYPAYTHASHQFLTNKLQGLGWLDTYNVVQPNNGRTFNGPITPTSTDPWGSIRNTVAAAWGSQWVPATLPRVYMGMILLPPAYKTEQYFRLVINHRFAFKGFRGVSMQNSNVVEMLEVPSYFDYNNPPAVGVLHSDSSQKNYVTPINLEPGEGVSIGIPIPNDGNVTEEGLEDY